MRTLTQPITAADRHAVATLLAAGRSPHGIRLELGLGMTAFSRIVADEEFQGLLARRRQQLAHLMAGDDA